MEALVEQKQELIQKLEEVRREKETILAKIEEKNNEYSSVDKNAAYNGLSDASRNLYNSLDETGSAVLSKRRAIEKKIDNIKKLRIAIMVASLAIAAAVLYILDFQLNMLTCVIYAAILLGVRMISTAATKKTLNDNQEELKQIRKHPSMVEFDRKWSEIYKNYTDNKAEVSERINQINDEQNQLKAQLQELSEAEAHLSMQIEDFDFNCKYKDFILFYGADRGNRYDLYLDGTFYGGFMGCEIVQIRLAPGIHSFRAETNRYYTNGELEYNIEFSPKQIVAGESVQAYTVVCKKEKIYWFMSGTEFQEITKTRMV